MRLSRKIIESLGDGYFGSRVITVVNKNERKVSFHISGFYLGMISDINDVIILTLRPALPADALRNQLYDKKAELDKFIYRAGHDLRGPLATIKGLINLIKIRENDTEFDRLIQLVDVHATTLDERLFHLMYLSHQEDKELRPSPERFIPGIIETRMRKMIEKNAFLDFLELHFSGTELELPGIDCETLYEVIENLLAFVLSLPITRGRTRILCRTIKDGASFRITIGAIGFAISEQMSNALSIPEFSYTDLVRYPQMINFYTAKKKADQLQAAINLSVLSPQRQRITVIVPVPNNATCSK
jgi:hypothetical protein